MTPKLIQMKLFSPLFVFLRIVIYGLVVFGMAEGVFYDAGHPIGDSYFSEATFTEIGQEIILFITFCLYLLLGYKWKEIRPVTNLVALFFLLSFIREFNFLKLDWSYPALVVFLIFLYFLIRDFKKIKSASTVFFSAPASGFLYSGFLATYVFSRLMGRSKFWKLMYDDASYRLAKAATEEGIELFGDTLLLISAIEYFLYRWSSIKTKKA